MEDIYLKNKSQLISISMNLHRELTLMKIDNDYMRDTIEKKLLDFKEEREVAFNFLKQGIEMNRELKRLKSELSRSSFIISQLKENLLEKFREKEKKIEELQSALKNALLKNWRSPQEKPDLGFSTINDQFYSKVGLGEFIRVAEERDNLRTRVEEYQIENTKLTVKHEIVRKLVQQGKNLPKFKYKNCEQKSNCLNMSQSDEKVIDLNLFESILLTNKKLTNLLGNLIKELISKRTGVNSSYKKKSEIRATSLGPRKNDLNKSITKNLSRMASIFYLKNLYSDFETNLTKIFEQFIFEEHSAEKEVKSDEIELILSQSSIY